MLVFWPMHTVEGSMDVIAFVDKIFAATTVIVVVRPSFWSWGDRSDQFLLEMRLFLFLLLTCSLHFLDHALLIASID